jgi:hypothetical protein
VIPEAPLVFSVAGLSASFAGLAGLVMALRRGADIRPVDMLRLRQMVEFSFVNIILAVAVIPLASILGGTSEAARVEAVVIGVYALAVNLTYTRRTRRAGLRFGGWWAAIVIVVFVTTLLCAAWVAVSGRVDAFEVLLVLLLIRPMLPFLLVLSSWEAELRGQSHEG